MATRKSNARVVATSDAESGGMQLTKDLLSGGAGGIAQVLVGHPFDTVKTKLQIQSSTTHYRGMLHCFREVLKAEGIRGLYMGAMSPVAGAVLHNANIFFSYGLAKKVVNRFGNSAHYSEDDSEQHMTIGQYYVAGCLSGITISMVETPVDLVKIKMQSQGANGIYRGSYDCARQIMSQYGIRGVYQGFNATVVRNVPSFGCYFAAYELAKRTLTPPGEKPSLMASFIGGSCAGFGFWATLYPLELVKTRMQSQSSDVALREYRGTWHCFRRCLAEEGAVGLFKGFVPCVTRAVPVNGAIFLAVAFVKSFISGEPL